MFHCIALLLCSLVLAQPNNLCQTSVSVSQIPFSYSGSTDGATKENTCSPYSAGDVWFSFNPTSSVTARLDLCQADYDSVVYVAGGACGSLSCMATNSYEGQVCPGPGSQLDFDFYAGNQYFIIVSGFDATTGTYTLRISNIGTPPPPPCSIAQVISSVPYTISDSIGAADLRASPCRAAPGSSYYADWYSFTPLFTDAFTVSLCSDASFDTYLYIGQMQDCPVLDCSNFNDDNRDCILSRSIITTTLTVGVNYYILVTSFFSQISGTYTMTVTSAVPPNNACNAATTITSLPYSVSAFTDGATADFSCSGNPSVVSSISDVWYSFTPSSNLPAIVVSTCFSPSAHTLYLASGSCASRQCIQSDSSSCPYADGITSGWIQSSMQASTTYFIAVASASPGAFQLDVFIPPVNDQCSGATQINSLPFTSPVASTMYARPDFSCSQNSLRNRDVFYTFTPSSSYADVSISLCGSNFDTVVFLASGTCAGLTCIAWNDDSASCGAQSVVDGQSFDAGTRYFIVVSGAGASESGSVSLSITGTTRLVGCSLAVVIPSIPYSFSASTSSDADLAVACVGNAVGGVTGAFWFTFSPTSTINNVYISACSSFASVLVFASGSCSSLQCSARSGWNSDFCLAQNSAGSQIASVSLVGGVQYFFVVTGSSASDFGAFTLTLGIDSAAEVSILTPAADVVIGGSQLRSLLISGAAGSFDAQGTVTLTISDSVMGTPDLSATAIVAFNARWSVPVNILSLADGLIVVNARLVDPSGNTAVATRTFNKDATTFVYVSAPAANSFVNAATSSSLLVQGTGEVGGSVIVTVMDGDSSTANVVSAPVTVLADGSWSVVVSIVGLRDGVIRLTASITDSVGNTQVSPTVTLNKDTTVSLVIMSPTPFQFTISQARAPSVTISGFGDPGNQVVVVVSDASGYGIASKITNVTPAGSWRVVVDVSSLSDGTLSFLATATDASNNLQSQSVNLMKVTQVSAPSISTPVNGATVGSSLSISGTALPLARVNVTISSSGVINAGKLEGAATISRQPLATSTGTWTTSVSISNMSGTMTIWATAKDSLNNVSPASPSVVVTKASS